MFRLIATTILISTSAIGLQNSAAADVGVEIVFSKDEIRIIDVWYRDHGSVDSQNGGHKENKGNKALPPGIAKNLQRGKPLPPGIAKQYLPDELRHTLPAPRAGYERLIIDGKVLLVEIATGIIHDILADAVLH
jgi:Ni/Co efflux regulator RcnB